MKAGRKMTEQMDFKSWAIVEVMGHNEYAGFVSSQNIAGAAMLRIDVPETSKHAAFTKYLSTNAIYGISPCSEGTAHARAELQQATPFASWNVEQQVLNNLRQMGLLGMVQTGVTLWRRSGLGCIGGRPSADAVCGQDGTAMSCGKCYPGSGPFEPGRLLLEHKPTDEVEYPDDRLPF
jgi:hypothetical protein